jgi:hypothetical protein
MTASYKTEHNTPPYRNLGYGSENRKRHIYGTRRPRGMEATQIDNAKYQRETVDTLPLIIVP